ncbi:MAG TPA: accessory factor UbiK family protein [Cellvibrionaceae bacterium]
MSLFSEKLLNDLQQGLTGATQLLPKQQLQAALQSALNKMEVVTREEFDAQSAVLARTRERLESLEREMDALKARTESPTES